MFRRNGKQKDQPRPFLSRLRHDVRGNTLAMMAMFLIPLMGLVGSAVDMSRLYVVKTRLQQACDTGALAGRKGITTNNATLDQSAIDQANSFFANNFKKDGTPTGTLGYMDTSAVTFVPTKTVDGQVAATASASVPMTITKMFGTSAVTISVACQARFDVADTDIMFVLDTTGSMACLPSDDDTTCSNYAGAATKTPYTRVATSDSVAGYAGTVGVGTAEKSGSRIAALRSAVLNFYDTFKAVADKTTNVRYGFVTYSSSVNVGKAILDVIPSSLMGSGGSEQVSYQSRRPTSDLVVSGSTVINSSSNGKNSASCIASTRTPAAENTYNPSSGTATRQFDYWTGSACQTRTETLYPKYTYKPYTLDVSPLVAGSTITDPSKVRGQTTSWIGCVETAVDTPGQTAFKTTSLPSELDPDVTPSGAKRWWPHLHDLTYARNGWSSSATDTSDGDDVYNNPNYGVDPHAPAVTISNWYSSATYTNTYLRNAGTTSCGKPVKRLGSMSREDVANFVNANDFVPMGGTYHDVGMIWATRLISPTGPWRNDTKAWTNRDAPKRVIIFLTDGAMAPSLANYGMYGIEAFDDRVSGTSTTDLTTLHNNRFLAACAAAKARDIDVWTITIGASATPELTKCATASIQALATTNGGGLSDAFTSIAKKLAMLRLTK